MLVAMPPVVAHLAHRCRELLERALHVGRELLGRAQFEVDSLDQLGAGQRKLCDFLLYLRHRWRPPDRSRQTLTRQEPAHRALADLAVEL